MNEINPNDELSLRKIIKHLLNKSDRTLTRITKQASDDDITINQSSVSSYIHNKNQTLSVDKVERLLNELGAPLSSLIHPEQSGGSQYLRVITERSRQPSRDETNPLMAMIPTGDILNFSVRTTASPPLKDVLELQYSTPDGCQMIRLMEVESNEYPLQIFDQIVNTLIQKINNGNTFIDFDGIRLQIVKSNHELIESYQKE